jgi:N-acetylglucosaminyldiphosphoundecaprenol N-acetyl-beta-D-mannosaminyltransferase
MRPRCARRSDMKTKETPAVRPPRHRSVQLFNLEVNATALDETAQRCLQLVAQTAGAGDLRRPALVFSLNPEKLMKASSDATIHALLRKATLLNPDGIGICLAARILGYPPLQRVPGSDLMPLLCSLAERAGMTVYVYGASAESNAAAVVKMKERWPGLKLVGASDGFQSPGTPMRADANDSDAEPGTPTVADKIRALRPDIVFVGLGSPRQERWMAEVGSTLPVGLMQGVGGTIDVLAGTVKRAPLSWRKVGLEWLYRLLDDPRRWRRQLVLMGFVLYVIRQRALRFLLISPASAPTHLPPADGNP